MSFVQVPEGDATVLSQTPAPETPEVAAEAEAEGTQGASPAPRKRRGFAAMDHALVREIAHRGGLAAHAKGTAHRFTNEEARVAGQKGGRAPHRARGRKIAPPSGTPTPA